jgi:deoxycytidylate deaminase
MSSDPQPPDAQTELFIGLVGAVGTDLHATEAVLKTVLAYYGYQSSVLRMSAYLKQLEWDPPRDLPEEPFDVHVWEHMKAGTDLRNKWERGDALALLALNDVAAQRRDAATAGDGAGDQPTSQDGEGDAELENNDLPPALDRHCFIIRSLKHPDEVETLRTVLGPRFFLLAAYSPRTVREKQLRDNIADSYGDPNPACWAHQPEDLMKRDEAEKDRYGQKLRDTFHRADAFIEASEPKQLRADLERIVAIVFGDPWQTPTKDEYALFAAEGAARRSAEPGRQVGAAIAARNGSIIALGTNEVPRAFGGLYWQGDKPDGREFAFERKEGEPRRDTNEVRQHQIADDILDALGDALSNDRPRDALREAILETQLGDLTEYGRAVHAEMDALLDAAAKGAPVRGCTLYTTTFPCHNCARHMLAAGISRVVYVAPYAKSQALALHRDSIDLAPAKPTKKLVPFMPFVGVAPRRYLELFDADWRKRSPEHMSRKDPDTGVLAEFEMRTANPVFTDLEPEDLRPVRGVYRYREARAVAFMHEHSQTKQLALTQDEQEEQE